MNFKKIALLFSVLTLTLVSVFALTACGSSNSKPNSHFTNSVTAENFDHAVIQRSYIIPVLVYFYETWCPFCTQQNPYIQELLDNPHNDFELVTAKRGMPRTATGTHPEFPELPMFQIWLQLRYGYETCQDPVAGCQPDEEELRGVPGFVLFQNGEPIMRRAGVRNSRQQLIDMVTDTLNDIEQQ